MDSELKRSALESAFVRQVEILFGQLCRESAATHNDAEAQFSKAFGIACDAYAFALKRVDAA